MKGAAAAVLAGVVFAVGLAISGMATPAKVTAFLDVRGAWDPSLAFVMASAIGVHALLRRVIRRRHAPLYDDHFHDPTARRIDARLVIGSALFGIGWGVSGYCPGPALISLAAGVPVLVFVGAMIAGIVVARLATARG